MLLIINYMQEAVVLEYVIITSITGMWKKYFLKKWSTCSCNPNAECIMIASEKCVKIVVKAKKSIERGQEITISYMTDEDCMQSVHFRYWKLLWNYCFECHCEKCEFELQQEMRWKWRNVLCVEKSRLFDFQQFHFENQSSIWRNNTTLITRVNKKFFRFFWKKKSLQLHVLHNHNQE